MALRYAYNTNGCAHHRLPDALRLIAGAGYEGVALTLDWHHLDPLAADWQAQTEKVGQWLEELGLDCVIETGARYLLNPAVKHEPTLINPTPEGRARRVSFLKRAIDIAGMLGAETVSFWSGVRQPTVHPEVAMEYLVDGLLRVTDYAGEREVSLSLEPEPGMLIETNADYDRLLRTDERLARGLSLALDLGHVWVTGEDIPARAVERYADRLGTVSLEGMNRGVHLHLPPDEGDLEMLPLLQALQDIDFRRLVCLELSRESPRAHRAIPDSLSYLKKLEACIS
ncbi:sugar phosphate isomerase/epimerase [Lewinella marina]|uniref:Xylose isomerase n=1 Tax=Neolewinella marina TaxID=438751 RepID=A0A2G0CFN2_9BACT|nr:sugar phosphate isomerase/epimerase family protein [Neolewinella marina]NJB85525.1 sugar phosphate isomerase/epimerase [Neolewinella marina]PHK98786.1 xylose isomerase [Neolewinella marina]